MDVLERLAAELQKFSSVRGSMPAGKNESLLRDAHDEIERLRTRLPEAAESKDQLLFVYESILTEMRKFAPQNATIGDWVRRLDFARDEAVHALRSPRGEKNHG